MTIPGRDERHEYTGARPSKRCGLLSPVRADKMLTVGSLFSGLGGIELGLEQTGGFKTIWSVENDKFCNEIRRRHWPDVPQFGDVREFPPAGGVERPDVISGGSPCQGLSVAGKRAGFDDERSGLFREMVRIVRILRPRYVVWENVRGVFSSGGGADFRAVLGNFSDLGYDAEWTMLRASDFGYPHGRARVFVVAYRPGARRSEEGGGANVREERGGECLLGEGRGELANRVRSGGRGSERQTGWAGRRGVCEAGKQLGEELADGWDGQFPVERGGPEERDGARSRGAIPFAPPGPGLTYDRLGHIIKLFAEEPEKARAIFEAERRETERWAAILERWPWLAPAVVPGFRGTLHGVSFVVDASRGPRLRALGNAVVPALAEWVGEKILEWENREREST